MIGTRHDAGPRATLHRHLWMLVVTTLLGACGSASTASHASPSPNPTATAMATATATATAAAPAAVSPTTTTTSATSTRCHTSELALTVRGLSPGAGQRYAAVDLTNQSGHRCEVYGYVGMQLFDAGRAPVPTDVVRNVAAAPHTVQLAHGQAAYATLHWTVVPGSDETRPGAPCEPVASTVEVTPPDETTQLSTAWNLGQVCLHGRSDVDPLMAGTGPAY